MKFFNCHNRRHPAILLLAALLLPLSLSAQQSAPVRISQATLEDMAPKTQVAGTVVSLHDARLAAEVEGNLLRVADVGTRVAAGEVVAEIDATTLQLRVAELQAEQSRARARLQFLETEEQRLQKLASTNLASATQLDQTRSERDVAASDLRVAEARLAQLQDQIDRSRIKAPFAGTVVARLARAGERLDIGREVVRLVDSEALEVVARAPLEYIDYVSEGMQLDLQSRDNRVEKGQVRTIVAVGSENTHVFELRLDVDPGQFPVGQTLRVWVPTSGHRQVLAVPRDALVLRTSGASVYIIDGENHAQRIQVTTGIAHGDLIEVQGDLNAGDRVIIRGNERLQPGQPVTVIEG